MFNAGALLRFTVWFSLAYAAASMIGCALDGRLLQEENVWRKPLKFGVSTALHSGTMLWALMTFSPAWQQGKSVRLAAGVALMCALFELVYIGVQAARGEASHFNLTTPFHASMYFLMAVAAVALVVSGGAFGVVAFLDAKSALAPPIRYGIAVGFILSAVLTIVTGLTMGGRLPHYVGLEPPGVPRVPGTGWSLTVGDLRVPHFLGLHLMQSAPLAGYLVSRFTTNMAGIAAVAVFCLVWTTAVIATFQLALAGRAFGVWLHWR
jgi:hypothetical protein